jgi:hypothetical protein
MCIAGCGPALSFGPDPFLGAFLLLVALAFVIVTYFAKQPLAILGSALFALAGLAVILGTLIPA